MQSKVQGREAAKVRLANGGYEKRERHRENGNGPTSCGAALCPDCTRLVTNDRVVTATLGNPSHRMTRSLTCVSCDRVLARSHPPYRSSDSELAGVPLH